MPNDPKPEDDRRAKAAKALDAFLDRLAEAVVAELKAATAEPAPDPCKKAIREPEEPAE